MTHRFSRAILGRQLFLSAHVAIRAGIRANLVKAPVEHLPIPKRETPPREIGVTSYRTSILILAIVFLASCSSPEVLLTPPMPSTAPPAVASPSASLPRTATATLTHTPETLATPSPVETIATSMVALPPKSILEYQRLEIASSLPASMHPTGALIFYGKHSYRLDFDQQIQQEISEDNTCFSTSPDRKWLAYCQIASDSPTGLWLIVESADGQQQKKLPAKQEWQWYIGSTWLDNERLVFNLWKDKSIVTAIYPVAVVNPFTGEENELASDYPDLQPSTGGPAGTLHFVYSTVVYDPSLNLVVYPQTKAGSFHIVLWDQQAQRTLARVEDINEFYHTPLWSFDGKQFAIAVNHPKSRQLDEWVDEWFSVSREGQVQQLTHFGDFFEHVEIGAANWSPDGQHLAFWLDATPSLCEGQHLALLETETQHVTDYCVPGSIHKTAPPPIWSPDSQYVAVENFYDDKNANAFSHVILVDTKQNRAARIGENVTPVGWLIGP